MMADWSQQIGELNETPGEVNVEWAVNNIHSLSHDGVRSYRSPPFFLSDSCWVLKIFPMSDKAGRKRINLGLFREDFGPPKIVTCSISYRKEDRVEPIIYRQGYAYSKRPRMFDENDLMNMDLVTEFSLTTPSHIDAYIAILPLGATIPTPSGTLAIICTIKSEPELPLKVSLFRRLWDLSHSLREIFTSKEDTDIKLKLKDQDIHAHSIILKSRHPDFFSKFNVDTEELNIKDGDEKAFDTVLSYAYSGEPEGLSSENVWAVYRIARECNLQELKDLCIIFLEKSLSVDGVCDVIVKSDHYRETELKNRAKEFFAKNSSQILETDKWESFRRDYIGLLPELLEHMMQ